MASYGLSWNFPTAAKNTLRLVHHSHAKKALPCAETRIFSINYQNQSRRSTVEVRRIKEGKKGKEKMDCGFKR